MSIKPSILKENYRSFLSDERILLTGHSHQAWPDCARDALNEGFEHAAQHVDDKWAFAFQKAESFGPFTNVQDYIMYDRIVHFEVSEY